jgi:hypothetical protein
VIAAPNAVLLGFGCREALQDAQLRDGLLHSTVQLWRERGSEVTIVCSAVAILCAPGGRRRSAQAYDFIRGGGSNFARVIVTGLLYMPQICT